MTSLLVNYQRENATRYWWQKAAEPMPANLTRVTKRAKESGQTIVLVTGVFDLLHQAHRDFLQAAATVGDVLVVGVECDRRVRQLKGEGRPAQTQLERYLAVLKVAEVAAAVVLPADFDQADQRWQVLQEIKPDFLAVSSSSQHLLEKERILRELGGKMVVVQKLNPHVSTSKRIAKQRQMAAEKLR